MTQLSLYERLRTQAFYLAEVVRGFEPRDPQSLYLREQAERFRTLEVAPLAPPIELAEQILEFLRQNIRFALSGELTFAQLRMELFRNFGFDYWSRLMDTPPMGHYADECADFLRKSKLLDGLVLEVGAGTGALSRRISPYCKGFIASDRSGSVHQYDFDQPGVFRDIDTLVAYNAIHCARDKLSTLSYFRDMLRPLGWIVLAEGQDRVRGEEPWALNQLFGCFDGWWDIGGFLSREDWLHLLFTAGYTNVGVGPMTTGPYDLGGLVWAQRPAD